MKQYISSSFKQHTLIYIYSFVILLLTFGVYSDSGTTHMSKMLIYTVTLFTAYILLNKVGLRTYLTSKLDRLKNPFSDKRTALLIFSLLGIVLLILIVHFVILGGIPIFKAMELTNKTEIAQVRRSITADSPRILNYLVSFNIRAFIPFLILLFFVKNKRILYWLMLIIGSFYSFSLMQKGLIVSVLAPVLFFSLFQKKYLHSFVHIALISLVIYGQFVIANPSANRATKLEIVAEAPVENSTKNISDIAIVDTIKKTIPDPDITVQDPEELIEPSLNDAELKEVDSKNETTPGAIKDEFKPSYKLFSRLFGSLTNRLALSPGKTASAWFNIVPAQKPFLYGDGYRWLAKLKGNTYHNYFLELYPIMYPEHAATGLKGSVNTASFVVDYSNFGKMGLIYAGILLAIFFIFVEALYENDFKLKFSINLYPILIISSTMLTTTLLTHGWAFILIFYSIFLAKKLIKA